jgi:hypothetical protein
VRDSDLRDEINQHCASLTIVPRVLFAGGTTLLLLGLAGAELLLVVIDPNPITIFRTVFFQQSIIAVVLMWGILLACCSLGAMVNSQLGLHRSAVMLVVRLWRSLHYSAGVA